MASIELFKNPLVEALGGCQNILLAGAGGGFDVYSALPLYFALQQQGKRVYLANYSFSTLIQGAGEEVTPVCVRVNADAAGSETYFPERRLCEWFRKVRGEEIDVFAFQRCGVRPLRGAYEALVSLLDLDAIVLVDGGTDSLMRGDESGLGTPIEDLTSMVAVDGLPLKQKILTCLGFGVDFFHGVCHAQCFEAIAALTRRRAFLGATSILPGMPEADLLLSAIDYANERTGKRESIVCNSIASAIEGQFGNHHRTGRTAGSKLWINPLMSIYWSFELRAVIERCLYATDLEATDSMDDVIARLRRFRQGVKVRDWDEIPI